MNLIKEKVDKIYEKYGEYLHFNYVKSKNNDNEVIEKWNIYMSDIGHNYFENKKSFLSFLDMLIDGDVKDILKANLSRAEQELFLMQENIETVKSNIIELKSKLKTTKEEV